MKRATRNNKKLKSAIIIRGTKVHDNSWGQLRPEKTTSLLQCKFLYNEISLILKQSQFIYKF